MAAIVTQEEAEEAPPPTFTARLVIKGWTKGAEEGDVNKGLEQLAFEVSKGRALLDDLCVVVLLLVYMASVYRAALALNAAS